MTQPIIFSEGYYRQVIHDFGYDTFELHRFNFELAGLSHHELNLRYLCHHAADRFIDAPVDRRIITTGFGMSGPPHMATASHIMKMISLQRGGERCQIVLGDLDAYNGRSRPFSYVHEPAEKFHTFALRLGFDEASGTIRDQSGYADALSAMYLLGRYAEDSDFISAEEDNHAYYVERGIVDPSMTFRRRLSLALMAADFVTLGQDYDAVLVMLGIDEHKYVRFAQDVAMRFDQQTPLRSDFTLTAIYARLNTGFGGHPKFSKSIPGSGISVEDSPDDIKKLVMTDDAAGPESSPVYQLMYQMTYCSHEGLLRSYKECEKRTLAWVKEKERFADYLIGVTEKWPA